MCIRDSGWCIPFFVTSKISSLWDMCCCNYLWYWYTYVRLLICLVFSDNCFCSLSCNNVMPSWFCKCGSSTYIVSMCGWNYMLWTRIAQPLAKLLGLGLNHKKAKKLNIKQYIYLRSRLSFCCEYQSVLVCLLSFLDTPQMTTSSYRWWWKDRIGRNTLVAALTYFRQSCVSSISLM